VTLARPLPASAPAPSRQPFHVVVGPRSPRRLVGHVAVFTLVAFSLFFLLLVSRITLDRSAFTIQEIERRIAAEEARYWELRLEVTRLQDPERIAGLAAEMGMVYPADLRSVEVPGLGAPGPGIEERWASLKTLLSAQP
jgi:hypothetical protein